MKVLLRPPKPYPPNYRNQIDWTQSLPFNVNPRGILVHRVKSGQTHTEDNGERSHDCVHYWCGNVACGEGVELTADPPEDRILCSACERIAVEAGEKSADELAGHHVHIGRVRAYRECCRESDSN